MVISPLLEAKLFFKLCQHQLPGCHVDKELGRLVSESACERENPGSNPAAAMVDAARITAWDLGNRIIIEVIIRPKEWARSVPQSGPYRPPGGVEEMQGGGRRVRLEWGAYITV
ncbi:hypothetical protein FHG87_019209 [Trinorchestia longiramus]|nr:hypothetical protein FHG87_019209 [Trinorchestia longiramus]